MTPAQRLPAAITVDTLRPHVEEALDHYRDPTDGPSPLAALIWFQQACKLPHRSHHQITNQIIDVCWETLQQRFADDALLLEKRYFDGEKNSTVAKIVNVSENYVYPLRRRALDRLTEILLEKEHEQWTAQRKRWLARLDTATYVELFGVEEVQAQLSKALMAEGPPWLVQVEGMGGSGKTSLADAVTREAMTWYRFIDFAWVSVQPRGLAPIGSLVPRSTITPTLDGLLRTLVQQLLPTFPLTPQSSVDELTTALESVLKAEPHLIVLDNLETIGDQAALVDLLQRLANPTRFLLTSRITLPTLQPLYRLPLPPLSASAAYQLLRTEAGWLALTQIAQADDATLQPIYETVGGSPLALRLVLGLAQHYDLPTIVKRLRQSGDYQIDQLYRFIFAECWGLLNQTERDLLIYMPLALNSGDTIEWIASVIEASEDEVYSHMATLMKMNLVNVHRDSPTYRYSIHPLTCTFLLNDAIDWRD